MNKSLIDLAYEYLLKRKHATFKEIYEYAKNVKEIPFEEESKEMVSLYTDIVLDNRFLLIKDNEWGLREDYKYDDVKKQLDFLFAITDDEMDTTEILLEEVTIEQEKDDSFEELNDDVTFESDDEEEIDWDEIEKELEENN